MTSETTKLRSQDWCLIASLKKSGSLYTHALLQAAVKSLGHPDSRPYNATPVSQWYPILRHTPNLYSLSEHTQTVFADSENRTHFSSSDVAFYEAICSENLSKHVSGILGCLNDTERITLSCERIHRLLSLYPAGKPTITVDPNFLMDNGIFATNFLFETLRSRLSGINIRPFVVVRNPRDVMNSYIQMLFEHEKETPESISKSKNYLFKKAYFSGALHLIRGHGDVVVFDFKFLKDDPLGFLSTIGQHLGIKLFNPDTIQLPVIPNKSKAKAEDIMPAEDLARLHAELVGEVETYKQLFKHGSTVVLSSIDVPEYVRQLPK
ncbi:MAG: sulfotransferase domain-containing protein [Rhodospirillaceae bacterium]